MEDFTPEEHRHVAIVARVMHHNLGSILDVEDLRQEGYIALMKAKQLYDPAKARSMSKRGYCEFIMKKRMIDAARRYDQFGRAKPEHRYELVPIDAKPGDDYFYDKKVSKMSTTDNTEADTYEGEVSSIVRYTVDSLPKRLRAVVHLYYYEEHTMKDIGKIIGTNESRVSQLLAQAHKVLRLRLCRCAA